MKIKFLICGKIREKYYLDFYQEYLKRLSKYAEVTLESVPDLKIDNDMQKVIDEEGKKLLSRLSVSDFVIILDLKGKELDSVALSTFIDEQMNTHSSFVFVVGGSLGLSEAVKSRANYALKLSNMTLTHPLALAVILEQVYRAYKIINNETYHK